MKGSARTECVLVIKTQVEHREGLVALKTKNTLANEPVLVTIYSSNRSSAVYVHLRKGNIYNRAQERGSSAGSGFLRKFTL